VYFLIPDLDEPEVYFATKVAKTSFQLSRKIPIEKRSRDGLLFNRNNSIKGFYIDGFVEILRI
tara:strand:+ start:1029 stop:1217 length:189 start_codon:yes stop_codon:yes gene_type:complete